jgi:hypothetical protein
VNAEGRGESLRPQLWSFGFTAPIFGKAVTRFDAQLLRRGPSDGARSFGQILRKKPIGPSTVICVEYSCCWGRTREAAIRPNRTNSPLIGVAAASERKIRERIVRKIAPRLRNAKIRIGRSRGLSLHTTPVSVISVQRSKIYCSPALRKSVDARMFPASTLPLGPTVRTTIFRLNCGLSRRTCAASVRAASSRPSSM